jgi:L-asparaginase II
MPSLATKPDVLLTEVSRSGRVESQHVGALAVCHEGELVLALGDVEAPVFARSAVKPLQALPLLEGPVPGRLGFGAREVALCCASHDGTDAHVEVVRGMLRRGGLDEAQLGCGPHAPFDAPTRLAMQKQGKEPMRVHNNCSGKHTGFLLLAQECGDDLGRYLDPDCKSQGMVNAAVAAMTGLQAPVPTGVDGCGAPTFILPLAALARGFARLANPEGLSSVRAAACRRILDAAGQEPVLLSGERRLCSALLRSMPGSVMPKNGAEGVYAVALAPDPLRKRFPGGIGIAVKVRDGSERGYWPVIVDLLRALGCWRGAVPGTLADWHVLPVLNTNRLRVGEVRCACDWRAWW